MVIHFDKTFETELLKIGDHLHHEFEVYEDEEETEHYHEILEFYGNAKWAVVDHLNKTYKKNHDLYNWLREDTSDEVSYFLNEAGSNSLHHSEFKAPSKFHIWLGTKGYIIAIEQNGCGFNASLVDQKRIKENEGAAFDFFRKCKASIFFDDPTSSKTVFFTELF